MRFLIVLVHVVIAIPLCPGLVQSIDTEAGASYSTLELERFDVRHLDRSVEPCVNFFRYTCNSWIAANPIPPQEVAWGTVSKLERWNEEALRRILEQASSNPNRSSIEQTIGDYYAACMDEKAIDAKGIAAIAPELQRIQDLRDKSQLAKALARLHRITFTISGQSPSGFYTPIFGFASGQDFNDATKVVAIVDQGGLGLPDRDYYFRDDPKSIELRREYVAYLKKTFGLMGESPEQSSTNAQVVMDMETALAKASMEPVKRRDPSNLNHPMSWSELQALTPAFLWKTYLKGIGASVAGHYLVYTPEFFKALQGLLIQRSIEDWKAYLRAHLVETVSPLLSQPFVDENFDFYRRKIFGQQQIEPRWHRCVRYVDRDLGEALGQAYVARHFSPENKQRILKLVGALKMALDIDIQRLPWMTPATKKEARDKLSAMEPKIGYPDHWRDYTRLRIIRGDAIGNAFRASEFELQRQLAKIGKPVDRRDWTMTPQTTNAYYDPHLNSINFPAGILQAPLFDAGADDAANYGAIGALIGHEITHGFDDRGSKFDARGNLRNWWTAQDFRQFQERTECIAGQYSEFVATEDLHVNGRLTLGENTADNGGLRIALIALLNTLGQTSKTGENPNGLSAEQRFFISFGQMWCENATPEYLRYLVQTDQHSPTTYRVNGAVSNMPEFTKAFDCGCGQPMVRANACRVW